MLLLNNQITIILMDYDNDGNKLDKLNKWAKKTLTAAFGGVTIVNGSGTWLDGANLYEDKNKLYKCNYSGHLTAEQNEALLKVVNAEFTQGKQEAVSIMNGYKLAIIERDDIKKNIFKEINL